MKAILKIIIFAALLYIVFILAICEPVNENNIDLLIISKLLAICIGYVTFRLFKAWNKNDELTKLLKSIEE